MSGNVSFMGQSARFSVMPSGPQGNEIGITFGEYPYLITSTFTPAASIGGVELRGIPQPDVEQFGVSAAIVTLELPVTANYAEHELHDVDQFGVSAAINSLSLVTP